MSKCSDGQHDYYPPVAQAVEVTERRLFSSYKQQIAYFASICRYCGEKRVFWSTWKLDDE